MKCYERDAENIPILDAGMLKLAFVDVDLKHSELIFEQESFDEDAFSLSIHNSMPDARKCLKR